MPNANDGRRLEVVVNRLPLIGGRQLAIDTTFVEPSMPMGQLARANRDGVACMSFGRAGGEVGGRWSAETRSFLSQLTAAKAREEVFML